MKEPFQVVFSSLSSRKCDYRPFLLVCLFLKFKVLKNVKGKKNKKVTLGLKKRTTIQWNQVTGQHFKRHFMSFILCKVHTYLETYTFAYCAFWLEWQSCTSTVLAFILHSPFGIFSWEKFAYLACPSYGFPFSSIGVLLLL